MEGREAVERAKGQDGGEWKGNAECVEAYCDGEVQEVGGEEGYEGDCYEVGSG